MIEIHIGEIIRQRRMELKLTQEELCQGICEPCTMSRIETGVQNPTRSKLDALMQRLGLPGKKYYALMSQHELEIEELKTKIIAANVQKDYDMSLNLLEQLESIVDPEDHIQHQFAIRTKALCGHKVNGILTPYSPAERIDLLLQAIRLTVPSSDIEEINSHLYSVNDIKIINQLATSYFDNGEVDIALDIYYQLMKYLKKRGGVFCDNIVLSPLITYNYARALSLNNRHEETIKVAEQGIQDCIQYGKTEKLPGLLFYIGEANRCLGNMEIATERFKESFYIYRAMDDVVNAKLVKDEVFDKMKLVL